MNRDFIHSKIYVVFLFLFYIKGVIVAFDVTNPESFASLGTWINDVKRVIIYSYNLFLNELF